MSPERWQQIERLFHAALDSDPALRTAFLNEACAGDDELRQEVESLLVSLGQAANVKTSLPAEVATHMLAEHEAGTMAGRLLGHYQLLSPLGAGGMGQIYLAQDTRLGRKVALKLLPSHFTKDLDRVRRFEQEARAASALNHPNIITIHEMGQVDDVYFIATEFIEGQTLRQMIGSVGTDIPRILDIAAQVANALAASHAVRIAHRDIKPENIMVRLDGYVKVLDFGLAKLTETQAAVPGSDVDTRASATDPGTIMGTATYMSPEQARGLKVDERTDIFSMGILIYEMVTGTTPFSGETVSDMIASILTSEPRAMGSCSSQVFPELEQIVLHALVKDRDKRYQTANDLLRDLKGLAQELEFEAKLASSGKRRVAKGAKLIGSHRAEKERTAVSAGQGASVPAARNQICAACGATNSDVAKFCSTCGGSVVGHCSKCNTDLPPGARFCMSCGQQVGGITADDRARHARVAAATPAPLADKMRSVSSPAGERKVVTVLFADLSGAASSGEQIDPEDWFAILNQALDHLIPVIYRYEGTIARLVGNSLLAFFGAPVAHEDDPERAARAAVDLLAAARAYAAEVQPDYAAVFYLRVSLNTGPVIVGAVDSDLKYEHSVMGDTVSLAARLQYAAPAMTALVTEHTYRFISSVSECVDVGLIEVKGGSAPVRTYELRGLKTGPGRARGLAGLESPLVGRDVELSTLLQLSAIVQAGLGRVAVIIGEPGLGKSRLITEWKAAAAKAGAAGAESLSWAEGHCLSYGQGHPYHLLIDLLRSLVGVPATADESETRTALLTQTKELFGDAAINVYPYLGHLLSLRLEGEALERVQQLDPQTLQNQYLTAVRSLLQELSSRRPLVLILEDIHWADTSSTELLVKLLALAAEVPLLFCLVARPDIEAPGWKLIISARDTIRARLTELPLNELSEADSQQLLSNLVDIESLQEQARTLILEKSEGNPFFVEEVIQMLIDTGAIIKSGEKCVGGKEIDNVIIPANLQGLLLARVDRLPDEMKLTLRAASVIGRRFSARVLKQLSRRMVSARRPWSSLEMTLLSHLNTLESAGLIRLLGAQPELEYLFRHALVQDAVYGSLLRQDRKQLHLAVGEALELVHSGQRDQLAPTLAYHFERAEVPDKAVGYFTLAGDRARAGYANAEAICFYRAAISQIQRIRERGELSGEWNSKLALLFESLADILELTGQHQTARDTYDQALLALAQFGGADQIGQSRISRKIGFVLMTSGQHPEARRFWDQAENALGGSPAPSALSEDAHTWWREWIEIQVERMSSHYWLSEAEAMASLGQEVLARTEQYGTPVQHARVLSRLSLMHFRRERCVASDETLVVGQQALTAALASGRPGLIFDAHFELGLMHLLRRELDPADEQLRAANAFAELTGDAIRVSRCVNYLMVLARMRRLVEETRSCVLRVLNTAWAGQMVDYTSSAKASLAWIAWREGNLAQAREDGLASLSLLQGPLAVHPLKWTALLPLVAVAVVERNIEEAIEFAHTLLHPKQMRLPDKLTSALEAAIAAGERNDLETACAELEHAVILAEELGYL